MVEVERKTSNGKKKRLNEGERNSAEPHPRVPGGSDRGLEVAERAVLTQHTRGLLGVTTHTAPPFICLPVLGWGSLSLLCVFRFFCVLVYAPKYQNNIPQPAAWEEI